MLNDAIGLSLAVSAFEGNKAETQTMAPMINRLQSAHDLDTITVVADAGMYSATNKTAVLEAGLDYILGAKEARIPEVIAQWRSDNPNTDCKDGQIWTTAAHADGHSPKKVLDRGLLPVLKRQSPAQPPWHQGAGHKSRKRCLP